MSDARCLTRLRWHNGAGFACHDGVQIALRSPPAIGVDDLTEIDYEPGCCAELRERCDARREMEAFEIRNTMLLLQRISTAARAALDGQ